MTDMNLWILTVITMSLGFGVGVQNVSGSAGYDPEPDDRTTDRPNEVWQHYMHGVVDFFATPIDLPTLFENDDDARQWLTHRPIDNAFVQHDGLALRVSGGESITLPNAIAADVEAARGNTLRVFVWVEGDRTGRENSPNSYYDAPNMQIELYDAQGTRLTRTHWIVGTAGTFPYHCYYSDVYVPEATDAIKLHFYSRHGEQAYFSNLSWEIVTDESTYSRNDMQCPVTGSVASNVYYDEMNRQFRYNYWFTRHTWNYFKGPTIGLKGQRYDVTSPAGLARYYREKVKTDNDHMNHSLMYFASRYHFAKERDLLPEGMDESWLKMLAQLVIDDQDVDTGYWGTIHTPQSMGITFHLLDGLFAYYGYNRADREDTQRNDSRHMGVHEIPRAEHIARTTLAMQSTVTEGGRERLAGWPGHAYNIADNPNAHDSRASLVVSNNAVDILRRCERFVDSGLQEEIYESIRSAMGYILQHCVRDDGVWLLYDTASTPDRPAFMPRLLSASHYLERKIVDGLPAPEVVAGVEEDGRLRIQWTPTADEHHAVRVYRVAEGRGADQVAEDDLIAIVHRGGGSLAEYDPLIVLRKIEQGARAHWNLTAAAYEYTQEKLEIAERLEYTTEGRDLLLNDVDLASQAIYVTGVTWYGEESILVRISPTTQP